MLFVYVCVSWQHTRLCSVCLWHGRGRQHVHRAFQRTEISRLYLDPFPWRKGPQAKVQKQLINYSIHTLACTHMRTHTHAPKSNLQPVILSMTCWNTMCFVSATSFCTASTYPLIRDNASYVTLHAHIHTHATSFHSCSPDALAHLSPTCSCIKEGLLINKWSMRSFYRWLANSTNAPAWSISYLLPAN